MNKSLKAIWIPSSYPILLERIGCVCVCVVQAPGGVCAGGDPGGLLHHHDQDWGGHSLHHQLLYQGKLHRCLTVCMGTLIYPHNNNVTF